MLIAGLPITAWLLIILSTGLGLIIVIIFYLNHRQRGHAGHFPDESE